MSLNCSLRLPSGSAFSAGFTPKPKATWSYGGSTPAYSYGGNTFNSSGYLTNPSRSAQINANNAGALTRYEAQQMGLPLGGRR
jgi:hypothetical protein